MTLGRRRVVRVPASTANLGPGFDVMAAALSLALEVEVVETGSFAVHTELDVPRDRSNLVVRAFEALHPADDFQFRINSQIPLTGGLGSSAAAIVAGLVAADHIFELDADLMGMATTLEGHPDNVAAALYGGFVICQGGVGVGASAGVGGAGAVRVHRIPAPTGLEALLVVPDEPVRTALARAALPAEVPLADAVFNVAAAATLTLGLTVGDPALIAAGLDDRLHQPRRAHLFERSSSLLDRARSFGALGATISGAGPTVLVWCQAEHTGAVMRRLVTETEGWAAVLRAPFEPVGADVQEL
jgi:homoserine kinase